MESPFAVGGHSSPFGETINWSWQAGQNLFYSCCKSRLSTLTVFCNGRDCVNSLQVQVTQESQAVNMKFCQKQWTVPPDHSAPLSLLRHSQCSGRFRVEFDSCLAPGCEKLTWAMILTLLWDLSLQALNWLLTQNLKGFRSKLEQCPTLTNWVSKGFFFFLATKKKGFTSTRYWSLCDFHFLTLWHFKVLEFQIQFSKVPTHS